MTRRTAARRIDDRETSGAIDFDAALEAFLAGGDGETLLRDGLDEGFRSNASCR